MIAQERQGGLDMRHIGTKRLETDRLILRRYTSEDAEDVYGNWATDREACRFWTWQPHQSIAETQTLLAKWIAAYTDPDVYHWVMEDRKSGQAIGYIYLADLREQDESATVHYLVCRREWNRGLATEACKAVLAFGFQELGLMYIHTHHHADNPASGRVMEKAGLRYLGTEQRRIDGCERIGGAYRLYGCTKAEWVEKRAERNGMTAGDREPSRTGRDTEDDIAANAGPEGHACPEREA